MPFSIATWNINSVRLRMPIVERLLAEHAPDVLCLQETKCPDELFPFDRFRGARLPPHRDPRPEGLSRRRHHLAAAARDRRAAAVLRASPTAAICRCAFQAGGRVDPASTISMCRPAATSPIPEINPKFRHKLDFVAEMNAVRAECDDAIRLDPGRRPQHRAAGARRLVAQAAAQGGQPHAGRDRGLRGDAQGGGWVDLMRHERAGRAEALHLVELPRRRLGSVRPRPPARPHLVVGKSRAERLTGIEILRDARGWDRPSDHVPVIARFDWTEQPELRRLTTRSAAPASRCRLHHRLQIVDDALGAA